jgi:ribosomal protein S17
MENRKSNKKVFTGLVVSDKMDKTVVVKIIECRPISKEKCWNMQEIIDRAK